MTRFVPVTVLVVLAASRVASADMGQLPGGAVLTFAELYIQEDGGSFKEPSDPDTRRYYFNLAHCQCSKAKAGKEQRFQYLLELQGNTGRIVPAEIWVGTQCEDDEARTGTPAMCRRLDNSAEPDKPQLPDINDVGMRETRLEFSLYDVIVGPNAGQDCPRDEGVVKPIFLLADTDGASGIDYSLVKNIGQPPGDSAAGVDTNPPPLPPEFAAEGSDSGILVKWAAPPSRATDIFAYQALCAGPDGMPAKSNPQEPRYRNAATLCDRPQDDPTLMPIDNSARATANDTPAVMSDALKRLDPRYICGESPTGTATSLQIDGLENGTPYTVIVVAVDLYGNYQGAQFSTTITPTPATDFWEDLHGRGGGAEGGFCLLAETYGDGGSLTNTLRRFRDHTLARSSLGRALTSLYYATLGKLGLYVHDAPALRVVAAIALAPIVVLALLWHWLTLPGLLGILVALSCVRRRRTWLARLGRQRWARRLVTGAAAIGIALAALPAHAQGYQPYWANPNVKSDEEQTDPNDPSLVSWHAGIRIGPYLPDIDSQVGGDPGPFEQMFQGARPMPILDVDRILWTGFGQAGLGISIGYMQWFAHSFVTGSMPTDNPRARSPGDTNTFRLIPLALSGIYRLTYLDDEYGIPVVPYVRGGLAYHIWWLSARGTRVCLDGSNPLDNPMCELNRPRGASLGLQGSIGLAIRAERIDASTAMSMQQSGIQHAGIYAELSLAKVDGFGSETKLSVGDTTWFAGVNFEF